MTANDLVLQLTPKVQEAAERAKPEVLANLPAIHRMIAKTLWPFAMKYGIPAVIRIVIEFMIIKYRRDIEPILGEWINLFIKTIDKRKSPEAFKAIRDILDILHTPTSQFHPAVQQCLKMD